MSISDTEGHAKVKVELSAETYMKLYFSLFMNIYG